MKFPWPASRASSKAAPRAEQAWEPPQQLAQQPPQSPPPHPWAEEQRVMEAAFAASRQSHEREQLRRQLLAAPAAAAARRSTAPAGGPVTSSSSRQGGGAPADTSSDEALARALQEEVDAEERRSRQQQALAPQPAPQQPQQQGPGPAWPHMHAQPAVPPTPPPYVSRDRPQGAGDRAAPAHSGRQQGPQPSHQGASAEDCSRDAQLASELNKALYAQQEAEAREAAKRQQLAGDRHTQPSPGGAAGGAGAGASGSAQQGGGSGASPGRPAAHAVAPQTPSPARPAPGPPPQPQRQGHRQDLGQANLCPGCGASTLRPGSYVGGLGRRWHAGCFRCGGCGHVIAVEGGRVSFMEGPSDSKPYHPACHRERFGERCIVCNQTFPSEGGRYTFIAQPFWKGEHACPRHARDGTPTCSSCGRWQPRGEEWAELSDGRSTCLLCLETSIASTQDAQPLVQQVMAFFEKRGMPLPERPPVLLVDDSALNAAEEREGRSHEDGRGLPGGAPVFHCRGLTLLQEYTQLRTVRRSAGAGAGSALQRLLSAETDTVAVSGPGHCEVTAVLVLYSLPFLLTGSILAHELMHCWLRLSGHRGLPPPVEEGLCQLLALLWLESQAPPPQGSWEERLASFFAHQIRADTSPVYGDGFRLAFEAFQKHGLRSVLSFVKANGRLPVDEDGLHPSVQHIRLHRAWDGYEHPANAPRGTS